MIFIAIQKVKSILTGIDSVQNYIENNLEIMQMKDYKAIVYFKQIQLKLDNSFREQISRMINEFIITNYAKEPKEVTDKKSINIFYKWIYEFINDMEDKEYQILTVFFFYKDFNDILLSELTTH